MLNGERMSSFPAVKAESISLLIAREPSFGVQATTGWQTLEPNPDGLSEFYPKLRKIAPVPLTTSRQLNASQTVDLDASPKLTHDLTKDLQDAIAEGWMLARARHTGGTGQAYFVPTARTASAYSVGGGGNLQAGTLVVGRGWANSANNGLFVVGSSSTNVAINVAGGVAETPIGHLATLEVAGFRGAAGDIGIDVNGNVVSQAADFTTMGLVPGMWIWVGGTIGSAFAFATGAYRGFAKITAVSAHLLSLARRAWTVGPADAGAGQTIDLYWGRWLRTVAFTDPDYVEPSYTLELSYPKMSNGIADEFTNAVGCLVDQVEINAPAAGLVTTSVGFVGKTITDPSTTRAVGANAAAGVLAIDRYNTVNRDLYERLQLQADESVVSEGVDVESWRLGYMNHVTMQKGHGVLGGVRPIVGKAEASLDMSMVCTGDAAMKLCSQNLTGMFGSGLRTDDGGIFIDLPALKCSDAPPKFPANGNVMLDLKLSAFRDPVGGYTLGLMLFPYLPAA